MPPRPIGHAHGGDEEEEVIVTRTDGPPFFEIPAKHGGGFVGDYERARKFLGEGSMSLESFTRDLERINKAYLPTAHLAHFYLRLSSGLCVRGRVCAPGAASRARPRALASLRRR